MTEARKLYEKYCENHPTFYHMPKWEELIEECRLAWIEEANEEDPN